MMCINQCEKPLTIGFCRANKNRNVIPVSEDTDQSSPSVSDWLPLSVSFLAETHFDDLKGRRFLPLFKYSRVWFQCETRTPSPSCQRWPCQQRLECTETFMQDYFYFKEFPSLFSSYIISDATLCKFMAMNHWLIEIKSLYVDLYGLYRAVLNLGDRDICVFAFRIKKKRTIRRRRHWGTHKGAESNRLIFEDLNFSFSAACRQAWWCIVARYSAALSLIMRKHDWSYPVELTPS